MASEKDEGLKGNDMNIQGRQLPQSFLVSLAMCVVVVEGLLGIPAWGHGFQAQTAQHKEEHHPVKEVRMEIHMRDGQYYMVDEGGINQKELLLKAGEETILILSNDDQVAHEFITPLFLRTEVHFSGDAVGLFGKEAAGFRLDPGKKLALHFTAPFSHPFHTMYEVAWCSRHRMFRKDGPQTTQGELVIVTTSESS